MRNCLPCVYNLRRYFKSGERLYHCLGEVAENLAQEEYDAVVEGNADPFRDGLASSDMTVLSKKALFGAMVLAVPIALLIAISEAGDISEVQTEAALNVLAYVMMFFPLAWAVLSILGGIKKWLLSQRQNARIDHSQANPRPVTFAGTAIGLPIGIALVVGYGPSIWSISSQAIDVGLSLFEVPVGQIIMVDAPRFIVAWIVATSLIYGYRRWRKQ